VNALMHPEIVEISEIPLRWGLPGLVILSRQLDCELSFKLRYILIQSLL
jgi:hypothetical protein